MRVHQRTAGVPRVQRRVGLDHVLDETAVPPTKRSPNGADDSRGHCRVEAEGIADRDDELPDAQRLGVGELGGLQARTRDADHREVGRGVAAHDRRAHLVRTVRDRDPDIANALDDVRVRERVTIWRDDDATSAAPSAPHIDDARGHPLDDADDRLRVRVEERARWIGVRLECFANFAGH